MKDWFGHLKCIKFHSPVAFWVPFTELGAVKVAQVNQADPTCQFVCLTWKKWACNAWWAEAQQYGSPLLCVRGDVTLRWGSLSVALCIRVEQVVLNLTPRGVGCHSAGGKFCWVDAWGLVGVSQGPGCARWRRETTPSPFPCQALLTGAEHVSVTFETCDISAQA